MRVRAWIRARPILAFYLLAFVITWGAWWPMAAYNRGLIDVQLPALFFVGGLGPGIAAYIVMLALRGRATAAELLGPLLRWRVHWIWYVVAVLLFPAIWLAVSLLSGTLAAEFVAMGTVASVGGPGGISSPPCRRRLAGAGSLCPHFRHVTAR